MPSDDTEKPERQTYLRRRSGLKVQSIEGEYVVEDETRGLMHQLNQTASFVWDCCDGKSTLQDIAHQVASKFEIDSERAHLDVTALTRQLDELGLLESVEGGCA